MLFILIREYKSDLFFLILETAIYRFYGVVIEKNFFNKYFIQSNWLGVCQFELKTIKIQNTQNVAFFNSGMASHGNCIYIVGGRENLYTGDALERNWKHSPATMEYCTTRYHLITKYKLNFLRLRFFKHLENKF